MIPTPTTTTQQRTPLPETFSHSGKCAILLDRIDSEPPSYVRVKENTIIINNRKTQLERNGDYLKVSIPGKGVFHIGLNNIQLITGAKEETLYAA